MMNSVEANRVMEIVTEEEKKVKAQADHVEDLKKDAEKVLNEALPVLKDAQDALNTLDRGVKQSTYPQTLSFFWQYLGYGTAQEPCQSSSTCQIHSRMRGYAFRLSKNRYSNP